MWYLSLENRLEDMATVKAGTIIKSRIISIDYSTHQIYLSNVSTVINPLLSPTLETIGTVHQDGEVISIDENRGMLLSPNVYVREKQMSDKEDVDVQKLYKVGQKDVCYRIIDHDLIDNFVFVCSSERVSLIGGYSEVDRGVFASHLPRRHSWTDHSGRRDAGAREFHSVNAWNACREWE